MSPKEWIHDGDYRPFIAVMVFIVALTAASVLFAQCCVGDRGFMRTGYDFEGYMMRKFPVCVGLPKRTHPRVRETVPLEVQVEIVEPASAPAPAPIPPTSAATPPAPAPALMATAPPPVATATAAPPAPAPVATAPPPVAAATAAPPAATVAPVAIAAATTTTTTKEEEDEDNEVLEDDDEDDFDFDAFEAEEEMLRSIH